MGTSAVVEFPANELRKVVADPVRMRLLSALTSGTRSLPELQPVAAVPVPTLSRHLKVLRAAGLVTAVRRGQVIEYSLAPDAADRLRAAWPARADTVGTESAVGTEPAVGTESAVGTEPAVGPETVVGTETVVGAAGGDGWPVGAQPGAWLVSRPGAAAPRGHRARHRRGA
jgi:ArsR family transcriptional regulator